MTDAALQVQQALADLTEAKLAREASFSGKVT
jgi:hypothetical protein